MLYVCENINASDRLTANHKSMLYNLYTLESWRHLTLTSCGHTMTTAYQLRLSPVVAQSCFLGSTHLTLILFPGIRHGVGLRFVAVIGYFPVNPTDTGTLVGVEYLDS